MEATIKGVGEPRAVEARRGIGWWTDAWALFTKNAGMWIVLGLVLLVVFIVLSFVPLLGALLASLAAPVLVGGWLLAARKVEAGGALEVGDLFAGFKDKSTPLLVLGGLLVLATLVIVAMAGMLGFGAVIGMGGGTPSAGGTMMAMGAGMLVLLVGLALGLIIAMAFWFAPALVVFRDIAPVDALKASVLASLKNIVPFLLYSVIYFVAAIVASIPFGLGWIVLVPVLMLTMYVSYKEVFGA
jgi:hypothetical protein